MCKRKCNMNPCKFYSALCFWLRCTCKKLTESAKCKFILVAYLPFLDSYNDGDIFYSWLNQNSVRIDKKVQIPQFTLLDWRQKSSLHEYATGTDSVCNSYPCMSYHASRDWSPRVLFVLIQESNDWCCNILGGFSSYHGNCYLAY